MKSAESVDFADEEICQIEMPRIQWEYLNKFVAAEKEKSNSLQLQESPSKSSFAESKNSIIKRPPRLSISMRQKDSRFLLSEKIANTKKTKNTMKSLFSNEMNKLESQKAASINNSPLLNNTTVKGWVERERKKRSMRRFELLKEGQLVLLGDNSFVPEQKDKRDENTRIYHTFEDFFRRAIRKILKLKFLKKSLPVIHPEGRFKLFWNIFICLCILYQFFTITIELFFDANWDRIDDTLLIFSFYISEALKYLLLFDVLMNTITGYFHRGGVVMDSCKIFKHYLKKLLLVDFLVLFPLFVTSFFDENEQTEHSSALYNSKLSIIKMLFIFRLLKLKRTYYYIEQILSNNEKIEGLLALIELCFKILFTAHLFACTWFFIGDYCIRNKEKGWMDDIFKDCSTCDWRTHYLYSLYWSITTMITVGYGDITPKNPTEVSFAVCSMIFGCGLFGYSLSNIGQIFEKLFAQDNELKSKVRIINRFMRRKKIDFELQSKVRRYLDYILRETGEENAEKERELIKKLSNNLRKELILEANGSILMNSKILKNNFSKKTIKRLTEIMAPINLAPEELVFEEESTDNDQLFFVSKGRIDLFLYCENNSKDSFLKIKTLREGEVFGELSFFSGKPRELNAVSLGYTKLYTIKKADFLNVLQEDAGDYERFCEIRDSILLNNNMSLLFTPCGSCGDIDHDVLKCPVLKLTVDRDLVVRRYLFKKCQKRKNYNRKAARSKPSLKMMAVLNKVRAVLEENYDLEEYNDNLEKARADCNKLFPELGSPGMRLNNLTAFTKSKTEEENFSIEEFNDELEKVPADSRMLFPEFVSPGLKLRLKHHDKKYLLQNPAFNPKHDMTIDPSSQFEDNTDGIGLEHVRPQEKSNYHRKELKKSSIILFKNDAKLELQSPLMSPGFQEKFSYNSNGGSKIPTKATNNFKLLHLQDSSHKQENFQLFDLTFDVGRTFKNYFPHNNRANVIFKLEEKGRNWEDGWKMNFVKTIRSKVKLKKAKMSPSKRRRKIARLNSKAE